MTTVLKAKVQNIQGKNLVLSTIINNEPKELNSYYYFIDQVKKDKVYVFIGDLVTENNKTTFNVENVINLEEEDKYVNVSVVGQIKTFGKTLKVSEKGYVNFIVESNVRGKNVEYRCNYKVTEKQKTLFTNITDQTLVQVSGSLSFSEYQGKNQLNIYVKGFNLLEKKNNGAKNNKKEKEDETDFNFVADKKEKDVSPFDFEE